MPAWPSNLPAYVLQQGYDESLPDQLVESQMDVGPAKVRRRTTVAPRPFGVTIAMTAAQAADFETFFGTTLKGGSLTFTWVHPRTRAAATMRFRKPPPRVVFSDGDQTRYACRLEIVA